MAKHEYFRFMMVSGSVTIAGVSKEVFEADHLTVPRDFKLS